MNKNTLIFILMSIVFGLGAVFIAKKWLASTRELSAQEVKVVISTDIIARGTILQDQHLSFAIFPKSMVPDRVINKLEDVIGKVAKDRLYAGEIIRAERIAVKGDGSSLASLIGDHMRAVSIRVNDVVGVAGFLLPGNRVDVLNTFQNNKKANTEVILTNVKILAIDQSAVNDENKPQLVSAVTLEVELEQAQILMNARSRGYLQLALRSPGDDQELVKASGSGSDNGNGNGKTLTKLVSAENANDRASVSPSQQQKVELIRGITQESVRIDI